MPARDVSHKRERKKKRRKEKKRKTKQKELLTYSLAGSPDRAGCRAHPFVNFFFFN
jgi:hypothetical protein